MSALEQVIPKGYKQTEVGIIPEDWEIDSIGNLVSITTGNKNTQDRVNDGLYPFFVRSQTVERINSFSFDGEGVLTAGDGVGTGKIFHYMNGKFDFHQRVYLMYNFGEKLFGYYFYIYFSNNFYDRIMSMTAKSSVDSVRREMIAEMKVSLPPYDEQTAIANALSDVDALLTELEKLIAKKQAIKTATMQQLLTGKTRLTQFITYTEGEKQGQPKGTKTSELGEIPEDWDVVSLGESCDVLTGFPFPSNKYSDSGIRLLRGSNVKRGETDWSSNITQYWPNMSSNIKEYELHEGDIVVSMDGSLVGRSYAQLSKSDLPAILLQRVARIRSEAIELNYLKEWVCSKFFTLHCDSVKTVTAIPHISPLDIRSFKLLVPSEPEEQTSIATILSDMDSEIQSLEQRLAKTRQIKQGMMQELLTGRTRLPFEKE